MKFNVAKLIVLAALLCIVGFSMQQEPSKLIETYNNVENLFETVSKRKLNVQTIPTTTRMLVHVKIRDNTIMTDDFLNRMAELVKVENYKEFQFHSDIPVFTTRLTTLQIEELSNNNFAKNNIEWIKKVSNADKRSFAKLSLSSLELGGLRIVLDSKLNEMERFETMNRLKNWYLSTYSRKMAGSLSKLNIQQVQQSILGSKPAEIDMISLPTAQQDESIIRDFIREQANSLFDLDWDSDSNTLQVNLANFDYGVWKLVKQRKFDHPIVQSLKRREQIQKFFKRNQELEGLMNSMNNEMGQEFLNYLTNDESVDLVLRQIIHEVKNYGSNQVIQNGGGSSYTYMWDNGITGSTEVVSVIDTGITLGHCFFTGTNEPTTKTTFNQNYRKVVYYNQNGKYGDLSDGEGHGTHVAGTIAGYPQTLGATTTDKNVGVAKDAKLYAVDVQAGSDGGLYIGDMNSVLGVAFTTAGSKISSNSWGCGNPYECDYDCKCYKVNTDNSRTAVTDATCMAETGTRCCHYCNIYGYDSNRIDTYLSSNDQVLVVMAAGNDGEYSADSNMGDPSTSKNSLTVGASYSPSAYYKQFFSAKNYTVYDFENMASFSGRGPTYDNRIKPDIAAPGYSVISSLNTASCNNQVMSGTSMATPSVSGAAALVRHYLVKDSKKKLIDYNIFSKDTSQTLSGTLVKAMILHSGEAMKGFVQVGGRDLYLSQFNTPNKYHGFGRINLQNVLKIDTDPTSVNRVKNILLANRYSLDANQQVDIPLKANSVTNLKVTLVWYDLPSAADSTISSVKAKKLINDISVVVVVGSQLYFGNGAVTGNTLDTLNTAESVVISNVPQGNVTVKVGARSTNKGKQAFSLVISGDVSLRETPSPATTIPSTGSPFASNSNDPGSNPTPTPSPSSSTRKNGNTPIIGQSSSVRYSFTLILIILIIYLIK